MSVNKNAYNHIADAYVESDKKPDKYYSILPTVLQLAGNVLGKTVLDLGCGAGFFTEAFAALGAKQVIGIDNAEAMLELARVHKSEQTEYVLANIFTDPMPRADIINSPFVLNYAEHVDELKKYIQSLYEALNSEGKLILVFDLPSGKDLKKFGAKKILKEQRDATDITIELYNQEGAILCTLHAQYYVEETIVKNLKAAGFNCITKHMPIISDEGMERFGEEFWAGYRENCELGYITAEKK